LTSFFAQARSRKVISSSRPKISLPVTGNLANEILSGASLPGGLRVPTREAVGGVSRRLRRVILRRACYRRHRLQQIGWVLRPITGCAGMINLPDAGEATL
jgi:hypothetical protein